MSSKEIVIIHESLTQSIIADIFTVGSLVVAVLVGKWIESDALQWVAGSLLILFLIASPVTQKRTFTSIEDAKNFLDSLK